MAQAAYSDFLCVAVLILAGGASEELAFGRPAIAAGTLRRIAEAPTPVSTRGLNGQSQFLKLIVGQVIYT